jgi:hypothetical protein
MKQIQHEACAIGHRFTEAETEFNVREQGLQFTTKRKEGALNPLSKEYIAEMLPLLLEQSNILPADVLAKTNPKKFTLIAEALHSEELRGRGPATYTLTAKKAKALSSVDL